MLIVISNPSPINNEADLINALFDEGLEIFHLRKPDITIKKLRQLLKLIKPIHHHKIALHQHHKIKDDYGIRRFHFSEKRRKEMDEEELLQLKKGNTVISTSIHQIDEYKVLSPCFFYTFFGPVFNSISKEGYKSKLPKEFQFPTEEKHAKVIALGGISEQNMKQVLRMRFDGAAVLGAIWQQPNENIKKFRAIQQAWKQSGQ